MKLFSVALLWLVAVLSASASSVQFYVTTNNLDPGHYVFAITINEVKKGSEFKLTITRKEAVILPDCNASLSIVARTKDGGFSAQRAKPEPQVMFKKDDKVWKVEFIVSHEMLKTPDLCFVFTEPCHTIIDGKSVPMPCMDMYIVKLQDFLKP